jgi:hypothetical protein
LTLTHRSALHLAFHRASTPRKGFSVQGGSLPALLRIESLEAACFYVGDFVKSLFSRNTLRTSYTGRFFLDLCEHCEFKNHLWPNFL